MSAPTTSTAKLVRGKVARFTVLDACGAPILTVTPTEYVCEGIVTVTQTKNMDEGDEIKTRLMNGSIGTYEPGRRTVLNYTVEVQVTTADTIALTGIVGDTAILDVTPNKVVGWQERALRPLTVNFALEVWTDTNAAVCTTPGGKPVGYVLYPLLSQAYLTMDNIEDKEITFTIHAQSYGNANWGVGPYNVYGSPAAKLPSAALADAHRVFLITQVAPPAPTTGLQVLVP